MAYKIKILKRAQIEIDDAFDYYSKISNSALKNFADELQEAYRRLEFNPKYQVRYKDFRALPLKSFPFILIFIIDEAEKTVKIYSVFNTHQNPEKYP